MAAKSVIAVEKRGAIAIVSLQAEPVNIMNRAFWQELHSKFTELEADASIRGVVFQSGLRKHMFAAGLDINELYAKATTREKLLEYWSLIGSTLVLVLRSPMMTVAAIKGQCPAGGCVLSLCCDFRVITPDGSMGLNEVALGMGGVPSNWAEAMSRIIGPRHTERMICTGHMAKSPELLQLGMVDAVASPEELLPRALQEAEAWLKLTEVGRTTCKGIMRDDFAQRWSDTLPAEGDFIWNSVSQPTVLGNIEKVLQQLSGKKPAAKL